MALDKLTKLTSNSGISTVIDYTMSDLVVDSINIAGGGTTLGKDFETRNLKVTGLSTFVGNVQMDGNLTVNGTTTTLDTNLIGVDRVEVVANDNNYAGIAVTQSGTGDIISAYDGSTQVFVVSDGNRVGIADSIYHLGDDNTAFGFPSADTFKVDTAGVERLRIQSDGTKVMSNGRLTMSSAFIDFSGNVSTPQTGAAIFRPAADTLAVSLNNVERVRINSSGKVGIGTNDPDQTLEIHTLSGTNLLKASTKANSTVGLEIEKTGATTQSWRIADGQTVNGMFQIYDVTDSKTPFNIDTGQRILLGSTTSRFYAAKLQVQGTSDTNYILMHNTSAGDGDGNRYSKFIYSGTQSGGETSDLAHINAAHEGTADDQKGRLEFRVNTGASNHSPTEALRITSTGWQSGHTAYQSVGINTFASWARTGGAIRGEVGYNAVTLDYMYFGTGTTHPVALRTNNITALLVDTGQRVLVGHIASQEVYGTNKFQIQGTSSTTSGMSLLRHGGSPYLTLGSTGGNALGAVNALSSGNRIGQITFAGADGTDVNTHSASIAAYVDGSVSSNAVPGRLVFATSTGASELERMRISSTGTVRIKRAVSSSMGNDSIFLALGDTENGANVNRMIGFGYNSNFGTSVYPASIGYTESDNSGNTRGHLIFATRNTTGATDVPTERLRIQTSGKTSFSYDATPSNAQYGQIEISKNGASNADPDWSYLSFHRVGQIAWQQGIDTNDYVIAKTGGGAKDTLDAERLRIHSGGGITVPTGGALTIVDSGNSTANSTHTTGALRCNLIRSQTANNNAYTGTYFMNVNAAGGGIKSVGIVETGLRVGDFSSNLAATEKIKLTYDGHVEIKTDGGRLKIGAGNDLQMYHDNGGSTNHITCVNNHHLKLSCNEFQVYNYAGTTLGMKVDTNRKLRTNGATDTGHTGMIYIQGLSDPVADETHSNLSVRGEGGNGFACGTYEGTGNYASWIQAGYLQNFTGTAPSAIYPLVLQPNGAPVCVGNYNDASTTDAGLLRVQSRHGSNFYNDATLTLEHYNQSNAREQKWHFISASNQGTEAKSNSKFRQMAVPYNSSTDYQTFTDQIVYAHRVEYNSVSWYKFNCHASSSSRGGSARIAVTWSTRHAAGTGYGEYSFAWRDEHNTSRVDCFLRKQHFKEYTNGSYYSWTGNPSIDVYSCTGGGSGGAFYLKVFGHINTNSGTYDGGVMHHFHIIHNDNNTGGNNSYFEFVGNSNPGDLGSSLSFN